MLDTICDVLKKAYERNWISTRDGNASYRRKDDPYFYVTPSGVRKYHLNAEMLIQLALEENGYQRVHDEYQDRIVGLKPTGELALHYLLQKKIQDHRVVLHLHPTYIISAMYAGYDLQDLARQFPEINRYTRVGPMVPELPPISEQLAHASIQAFQLDTETGEVAFDIIGLKQHGVMIVAKDAWTAFEHCERLEHICQIVLASKK